MFSTEQSNTKTRVSKTHQITGSYFPHAWRGGWKSSDVAVLLYIFNCSFSSESNSTVASPKKVIQGLSISKQKLMWEMVLQELIRLPFNYCVYKRSFISSNQSK